MGNYVFLNFVTFEDCDELHPCCCEQMLSFPWMTLFLHFLLKTYIFS